MGTAVNLRGPLRFLFFESKDIKACIINSAGEQVDLTYGTDYTVSISTGSIGGKLYYPLADNQELTIWLSLGGAATAQAWAESETAPDPNDAESKSAKQWALIAGDAVPIASTTLAGKVKASASLNVNTTSGEATVPDATTTLAGIVYRATDEEANEGENTEKYVSPAHLGAQQDAFVELIDTKVGIDLANVSGEGRETVISWGMPDYSAGVSISTSPYTVTFNGFISIIANNGGTFKVNEAVISNFSSGETSVTFPVSTGDVFTHTGAFPKPLFPFKGEI